MKSVMYKLNILILSFILFGAFSFFAHSQSVGLKISSNCELSLLTCSPNDDAVYAFFGHSSIRVKDDSLNIDYVFDYGVFDFQTDNFAYRFIKGETDYMAGHRLFDNFYREYQFRGSGVKEQVLHLSYSEKSKIVNYLFWNVQLSNRVYRYNFVENNCSTKLRDIVEEALGNKIHFKDDGKEQTYRELINEYLVLAPWYKIGINLIIGSAADTIITTRQKDFIPQYLYNSFALGTIETDSVYLNLVQKEHIILVPQGENIKFISYVEMQKQAINSPLYWGIILVLVGLIISLTAYFKRKKWLINLFDTLLFSISTLCGCIIFYLMFFSLHPCVGANWNLIWLNPLLLLFLPLLLTKSYSKYVISYHFINFALLTLFFMFMYIIPQTIERAFFPYMFILWIRSGIRILNGKNILRRR